MSARAGAGREPRALPRRCAGGGAGSGGSEIHGNDSTRNGMVPAQFAAPASTISGIRGRTLLDFENPLLSHLNEHVN